MQKSLGPLVLILLAGCGSKESAPPKAAALEATSAATEDREAYAKERSLVLKSFDLNRDKRPDVFKFYKVAPDAGAAGQNVEQLVRKDIDLNNDGKVDVIRLYDGKNQVTEERTDLDFDGRYDELAFFEAAQLTRKEIDLNYDGKAEIVRYYEAGKLGRVESDRNGDGRVDTWEYYEGGKLDRVGTDNDGDGIVDKWDRQREAAPGAPETVPSASDGDAPR
jgi:hypothetical protein